MRQTQKGAGKVMDVPKSPKIYCAHPSRDQDVGTGLAALPRGAVPAWVPVWELGSEVGEGRRALLLLG